MTSTAVPMQVVRLLPLLASDHDNEVIAAARAICRTLRSAGCDLHDLAAAVVTSPAPCAAARCVRPATNFDMARAARDMDRGRLSHTERQFISRMCHLGNRSPSPRQAAWLADIFNRICREAA